MSAVPDPEAPEPSLSALDGKIDKLSAAVKKIKVPGRTQRAVRSIPVAGDFLWDWIRPAVVVLGTVSVAGVAISGGGDLIAGPDGLTSPPSTWHLRFEPLCRAAADGQPTIKSQHFEDPMPGSIIHDGQTEVTGLPSQGILTWHDPCRPLATFVVPIPGIGRELWRPAPIKQVTLTFVPNRTDNGQGQDDGRHPELKPFQNHVNFNLPDQELRDWWMCNPLDPGTSLFGVNAPVVGGHPCIRDVHQNGNSATFDIDVAGETGLKFKAGADITPAGVTDSYDAMGTYKDLSGRTHQYRAGNFTLNILSVSNRDGWGGGQRGANQLERDVINPPIHAANDAVRWATGWLPSWAKPGAIPDVNVDDWVRENIDMNYRKLGHEGGQVSRGANQGVRQGVCADAGLCDTFGQGG